VNDWGAWNSVGEILITSFYTMPEVVSGCQITQVAQQQLLACCCYFWHVTQICHYCLALQALFP